MLRMPARLYATKHNASVNFQAVRSSPEFLRSNRTMGGGQWDAAMKAGPGTPAGWDVDQLGTDLASGDVGNLNFLEPDQCDDMHGVKVEGASDCGKDEGILYRGDNYTDYLIKKIEASPVWTNTDMRSAIVIMFDEGTATTGFTACCGWNPSAGKSIAGRSLGALAKKGDGAASVESIAQYNQGNKGHGTSIFCVLTNQPQAPKHVVDSDAYSHISFVRTIQDMFGLADPGDDWSYMNRSKYTEGFVARNLAHLPEYLESADPHFDAVRAMNHAYRIPGDYLQKSGFASESGPQRGPDTNQLNAWALTRGQTMATVGRELFFDRSLSASGRMSCATCHDPAYAYGPPNDRAVQPGGPALSDSGTRAVPSLRYSEYTPPYSDLLDNPDGISQPGPGGGLTLDGRAPTLADQARIPLLAANEMANRDAAAVVAKIRASSYAHAFEDAFGPGVFSDTPRAFRSALNALQAFQLEDDSFHPYSSKYDRYASNKIGGELTPAERRGLAVYNNPKKGNCFACHYNGAGLNGSVRLFTDYTYAAIGVPRNNAIPANRDPAYYDLGLCGRPDHPLPGSAKYCGMFKTPTLRNVAIRKVFFHNGAMTSLRDVIRFYNTRDTNPERWYPVVDGVVRKFDDLPLRYHGNVDTQMPLDGRARNSPPAMSDQDIDDLLAFLRTLTDADLLPN
jgi:cytochrome c peroxidase